MIWYGCEHPAVLVWLFCPSNFQTIEGECIHVHCLVNKEVIVSKFLCCDRVANVNALWNAVHFWFESPASGSQSWPHGTESNLRGYHCSEHLRKWINVLQVFKPSYSASSKTCRFASHPSCLVQMPSNACIPGIPDLLGTPIPWGSKSWPMLPCASFLVLFLWSSAVLSPEVRSRIIASPQFSHCDGCAVRAVLRLL